MTPYYQDSAVTILLGDNRDILPTLGEFDLLMADPPYGIGESAKKQRTRGGLVGFKNKGARSASYVQPKDYGENDWDQEPVEEWVMTMARSLCRWQVIFGGNFYPLPPSSCWLVWDKENSGDFADGEMAWTNLRKAMRIKRHLWNGMLRKDQEERFHPTQKPLDVILWAISHAPDSETILDPWAGSGTTGRAAKDLGKKATLIEREERYCEIAAIRMQQEVLAL